MEDVATPFAPYLGKQDAYDCTIDGPDGFMDLTFKFKTREVVAALGDVADGDVIIVPLFGNLLEEFVIRCDLPDDCSGELVNLLLREPLGYFLRLPRSIDQS
jgi:hypothetical protein